MDKNLTLLPDGIPGELSVGGHGVARGYLNRPELTGEKFVDNPYKPGQKLYRSGDLVKQQENGEMEYLGRIDQQVKIRGYRVELGEIENHLMSFAGVKDAVVVANEDNLSNSKQLAAYITPDPEHAYPVINILELKDKGELTQHHSYELPNGKTVFYLNKSETDFMYEEIFDNNVYMKHGITLEDGACIFDIGANIGLFSLFVGHLRKNVNIYAFEPIPPIYEVMSLNARIYGLNLKPFAYGIGREEENALFTYYPHASSLSGCFADTSQEMRTVGAFIHNQQLEGEILSPEQVDELLEERLSQEHFRCPIKTLSQAIKETGVREIDLLKIDVEKSELQVLNNIAEEDWPKIRQIVLEIHDIDGRLQMIRSLLENRGYQVTFEQDQQLKNSMLYNMYALRPDDNDRQEEQEEENFSRPAHRSSQWNSPTRLLADLRLYLKEKLPDYMIPSYFVFLKNIPLTPSGKIDRPALPSPQLKAGEDYAAPRHVVEKKLVELWSEVLGIEKDIIGIDSSFFHLGGHSLNAMILVSKIHKVFDVRVPLLEVFKTPRIRELAEYIKGKSKETYISIDPAEEKEYYPMSPAQKRLFVLQRMKEDSIAYNLTQQVQSESFEEISPKKVEDTFNALIKRHESLRTSFELVDDQPVQKIHQPVPVKIQNFQLGKEESRQRDRVENIIQDFVRPFDLSRAPLLRVGLMKIEETHILMVDMHHIITDGYSQKIFTHDFTGLYKGNELPELRLQYKDYSAWQNRLSGKEKQSLKKQEEYWVREFGVQSEIPVLNLPTDYPRPLIQSFEGAIANFEIDIMETRLLKTLALDEQGTLYMVLLAIYEIFLSKISSQEDIVIGTPVAGRRHEDIESVIGMFVNTLALRNYPSSSKTFKKFLKEVKGRTLEAFENQDYPFEDLVDSVAVNRDVSRNPLFDVMFTLGNMDIALDRPRNDEMDIPLPHSTPGSSLFDMEKVFQISKFDLTLTAVDVGRELLLTFEYCTKLFKKETIHRFTKYFKKIVSSILDDPEQKISNMEILPEEEKHRILYEFNDTQSEYPGDKTLHELFKEQVQQTPDHIALYGCLPGEGHNTYRELNEKSNRLAQRLTGKGVKPDSIIGIMMESSIEMIIGLLGILKAGGAYLPIDPDYPQDRIDFMLKDSNAKILLTNREMVNLSSPETFNHSPKGTFSPRPGGQLAYIIYTSGTAGKPKGVMTTHYNVTRVVRNTNYIRLTREDRVLQLSNYAFDGSVFDIYGALLNSAALVMIKQEHVLAVDRLAKAIKKEAITVFFVTTALFNTLVDLEIQCFNRIRKVLFGGERVSVGHVQKILGYLGKGRIIHVYGPTETTVYATNYFVDEIDDWASTIPIGKPLANTTVYVLDKNSRPVPIGVSGEVYIGGDGTARGYLNNPELTCEKFDHDFWDYQDYQDEGQEGTGQKYNKKFLRGSRGQFFQKAPPGRRRQEIYKTGDLARWLPDGNIEFLGRIDHQVKIRGYRIELGEIESCLLKQKEIKEVVVLTPENKNREKYLCAYIVSQREIILSELREFLSKKLPDYMIPSYFVFLKKIPLTPSGKIDRPALPSPQLKAGEDYVAPRHMVEKKLVELWSEVLGIEKDIIGIDSNFFQLGGHSLKATILSVKVHKELNVKLPLTEIFKTPTIKSLAEYISTVDMGISTKINDDNLVLIKPGKGGANHLFMIHDGTGEIDGYLEFCKHLTGEFNCWGIRADKLENYAPRDCSIEELSQQYIEKIKIVQANGPYFIAGWSLGGTIAFEIVRQLELKKEEIGLLALIDSSPPLNKLWRHAGEFNLESELDFIKTYTAATDIQEKLKNVSDANQLWLLLTDYLETNSDEVEFIKKAIAKYGILALPNYRQLNIKESIYYLNMSRTLIKASTLYRPSSKIHTPVHYFAAGQSKRVFKNRWKKYCQKPLISYKIPGDHYSILKMPEVARFAQSFMKILKDF
jgi:amino acid adenylation domain-containing protein/FkbM family methyltransferase